MIRREEDGLAWLEFELLADEKALTHGIFLRHGGESDGAYSSLNFSCHVGDNPKSVKSNVEKAKTKLEIDNLVRGKLNHGSSVVCVNDTSPPAADFYDGLITSKRGLGLLITHADCQAAIIYDPILGAVANIHCGWRGNIANIYAHSVQSMKKKFGSKPENLLACISPSLSPNHAEFINYKEEWPEKFWDYKIDETHFDLWRMGEDQFLESGILANHIETARLCTYALPEDFFSYRREKLSGRHGTIVALK